MLVLHCADVLPAVGYGYVCVVGPRTLKHVTTPSAVAALRAVDMAPRSLSAAAFLDVLTTLSIPHSVVANGADWSGR